MFGLRKDPALVADGAVSLSATFLGAESWNVTIWILLPVLEVRSVWSLLWMWLAGLVLLKVDLTRWNLCCLVALLHLSNLLSGIERAMLSTTEVELLGLISFSIVWLLHLFVLAVRPCRLQPRHHANYWLPVCTANLCCPISLVALDL